MPAQLTADFAILDHFAVLGLSGSKIDITNPQTQIGGNVGLAPGSNQNFADGQIAGKLIVDPSANNSKSNNVQEEFGGLTASLGAANAAAIDASNEIASMTPTQQFDSINGSLTICSTCPLNVICVGKVQLDGSSTLTLKGCATDYFFINVSGKFAMTGNTSIRLDGVDPSHVIFNIVGSGEQVAFTGKSNAVGTFLAVNRDIAVSGATVNGPIIGGLCHDIAITSGAHVDICSPSFCPPCDCTCPSTILSGNSSPAAATTSANTNSSSAIATSTTSTTTSANSGTSTAATTSTDTSSSSANAGSNTATTASTSTTTLPATNNTAATSSPQSSGDTASTSSVLSNSGSPTGGLTNDFAILDHFGVLGLSGSKMDITNPQTQIGGNVGLAGGAKQNFADGQIAGKLVVDPIADNSKGNNVQEQFGIVTAGLGTANAAAIDAANEIASMKPTQQFNSINGSQTICSAGGMNVISVDNVQLDGSSTLTLKGCSTDYFFINVCGKFAMTGTSSIQLDGVDPSHVIFNITGSGQQVAFTGKSEAVGTFLAINRNVAVSGATVNGQIIGALCQDIAITSGAKVDICSPPFCPPCDCAC